MTHPEDIRIATSINKTPKDQHIDFLTARVKALENRVEFLEACLEIEKQNSSNINSDIYSNL